MDEALLSISQAGRSQLEEMLITLEPHGIFGSKIASLLYPLLSSEQKYIKCLPKSVRLSITFLVNVTTPYPLDVVT